MSTRPRVVGIDLSLTSTGLATISLDGEVTLHRVTSAAPKTPRHPRTNKPLPPTLRQRRERLHTIRAQIIAAIGWPDLAAIETPAYSSKTGAAHDRSGLWWQVVETLHGNGIPTAEVGSGQRAKYACGKGNADKDVVMLAVANRYRDSVEVTGNDVADALVLAAMGARHLGHPIEASLPVAQAAVLANVTWPAETTAQEPTW